MQFFSGSLGGNGFKKVVERLPGETIWQMLRQIFTSSTVEQCILIAAFCWSLWNRRNKWVWDQVKISAFGVKQLTFNMLKDWKKANESENIAGMQQYSSSRVWTKPPAGWIKVNVDAACGERIGLGCVVRDDQGEFLRAKCSTVSGHRAPREVEALGLKEALSWVKTWRNTKCIFETGAKLLVDAIHGVRGKSFFDTIVNDCIELLKHF